jgi:predicted ATPase
LAIDSAMRARDRFADGVWMADLSPLTDGALVSGAIAQAVGFQDAADDIAGRIAEREMLIVLDNCEHVTTAAASAVTELLRRCPNVKVLATSREPLAVAGEAVLPLPPMSLDDHGADSDAVRLFIDRVRLYQRDYELRDKDRPHVVEICTRLDGLPLAIELAAAHMRTLGPAEIAARMSDRFGLLSSGPRSSGERQQTLRSTLDWGYELLNERERLLLSRLTVFSGGFTLEAAERVCAGSGVDGDEVYGLLAALTDKSFVMRRLLGSTTRFWLLETIREYGLEKLEAQQVVRPDAVSPVASGRWLFQRDGEVWSIGSPEAPVRLKDAKGLRYLAVLVGSPGVDIGVLDLLEGQDGDDRRIREAIGDAGEELDAEAVRSYKRRLDEIAADLDALGTFPLDGRDGGRAAALEAERDQLTRELARGLGLGGRHRRAGSTVEKARLSVSKAIRTAITKISDLAPDVGDHLRTAVRTGTRCVYVAGDTLLTWDVAP